MLAINQADAKKQGYVPTPPAALAMSRPDVPSVHGLKNMIGPGLAVESVVKVDDTLTGTEEGVNAGSWAIDRISARSRGAAAEWNAAPEGAGQAHRDRIYPTAYQRGAHYVIDSADLMPGLTVEAAARGEKP
jgi:phosphonoacetaldehyde hydrolase